MSYVYKRSRLFGHYTLEKHPSRLYRLTGNAYFVAMISARASNICIYFLLISMYLQQYYIITNNNKKNYKVADTAVYTDLFRMIHTCSVIYEFNLHEFSTI